MGVFLLDGFVWVLKGGGDGGRNRGRDEGRGMRGGESRIGGGGEFEEWDFIF